MIPVLDKICYLATINLWEFMNITLNMDNDWETMEDKFKSTFESVREDMFLDDVFGNQS